MNKDLHDIDDLFRSALDAYKKTPSVRVKEKLDAALDKTDVETYKKKFIGWKKTALLSLLLLTGFVLYESGIYKTGISNTPKRTVDTKTLRPYGGMQKEAGIKNINSNNIKADEQEFYKKEVIKNNNKNSISATEPLPAEINIPLQPLTEITKSKIADGFANYKINVQSLQIDHFSSKDLKANFFTPFWMLTAFASYERAGYRLDSDLPSNITSIKHNEVPEPSFSVGILATRQLKKQWGLQTGIIYSHTDIGISPQKLYALQDPGGDITFKYITSTGYAYIKPGLGAPPAIGDSLITKEGKHSLKFISIPLTVKLSIGKNKLIFSPGAGIEANFITSAKVETEVESPTNPEIIFINTLKGAKPFYLSIAADAELRYMLNSKSSVSLRPAIRFAISPITENNVVETFPMSFGIGLGLTKKF